VINQTDNSTNTNNSNSARSSGNIPTISDDALRRQLEEARAETVEKNRRIGELERQLDSLVRQQKELSARQVQDLERQLLERQSEVDRLNATLQKTAEESAVWCNSWDMLKKENERLKSSLLLTIPSDTTALVSANGGDSANGNGSGVSSYGGGRYSGVLKLPPAVRRCWYEGEWRLFESRLADQQNFGGKEFLAVSDIPWPVSPATPVNCPLTFPMISSFLISDLKTDESLEFTRRLLDRFAKNRVQHEWGPCVLQRDRQRVSVRAEELTACLQKFINSCSI
jgi:hypothetical protein